MFPPMHTAATAPADRFALIIGSLLQAVAEQGGKRIAGPLTMLIWSRLRRMAARFAAIAAALQAGTYTSSSRPNHIPSSRPKRVPILPSKMGTQAQRRAGTH